MKRWLILLLGVVLVTAGVWSILFGFTHPASNISAGELVFDSEEAYSDFKSEIVENRGEFYSWDVEALTSSPPIIVKFRVESSLDYVFPYGDSSVKSFTASGATNALVVMLHMLGSVFSVVVGGLIIVIVGSVIVRGKAE